MGVVIHRFLQDDGIVVIDAASSSISRSELAKDLPTLGCDFGRVMALRRLPGAFAVGYEVEADFMTRISGKLTGEFFEALGQVVVGAEVFVDGRFKKAEGVVGSYVIVAGTGAEFGLNAAVEDRDLVAVDLSASGIQTLSGRAFYGCTQLAAVAFPPELESVERECFCGCDALHTVDLAGTQVKRLGGLAFADCGVTRVTVPASLRAIEAGAFGGTPLKTLDLSACTGIRVQNELGRSLIEVSLPREGFKAAAKAILQRSIEVLRADVGWAEVSKLLPHLDELGVDKLCVVSPRMGEYAWQCPRPIVVKELTDPLSVTAVASVKMTSWRAIPSDWQPFLRAIDLSGFAVERLPSGASLEGLVWLEKVVLPTGLRVLREFFFAGCCRLISIDTRYTSLEEIGMGACAGCSSLVAFPFPPTIRRLGNAFDRTSITSIDLTGTKAENVTIVEMDFLVELLLPRGCALKGVSGVRSLRAVTFGASSGGGRFSWHPMEVRAVSMGAEAEFSPGLLESRVYGEIACELGRETLPFPPP
jgi:hypothetical protein